MRLPVLLVLALALGGCEPRSDSAPPAAARASRTPLDNLEPPAAGQDRFVGVVEQRLEAGAYSYLAVRSDGELRWVATMGEGRPVGSPITVRSFGTRTNFRSPRLHRTFDEVVFGIVEDASQTPITASR